MRIVVREQQVTRDELYVADEVFMTGTAAEVTPIREVDDRAVGNGRPGPVTAELQKLYAEVTTRRRAAERGWVTVVAT
jgi:branched-chain amino acid aminotransferase